MRARRKPPLLRVVETGDHDPIGEARPVVKIVAGHRSEAIDEAELHLVERDLGLFQRGADVVRPTAQDIDFGNGRQASALRITPVGTQHMRERFTRHVDLQKFDRRAEKWLSVDCPTDFAQAYIERVGDRKLAWLSGVATAPGLRPDGSIRDRPGYDLATAIYYDPRGVEFPAVPLAPTRDDASAALDRLLELIGSFAFVGEVDRAVALSAILTAVNRRAMTAAPLHGITAPVAGSGKSKLANVAAILAAGHPASVIALGQRDEESEKRLVAVQLAGDLVVTIDNAERPISGDFLCQAVTEPLASIRILGTSTRIVVPNLIAWQATGNNLKFAGDMGRRALLCRLDPGCERPELREFETPDPIAVALRERPVFVIAVLTIVRAFLLAGCPRKEPTLGSFADWSRWVRDPLLWLGCEDPAEAMAEVRREDPELQALRAVLAQWSIVIGDERVTTRQLAEKAAQQAPAGFAFPDLREVLLAVAAERGEVNTRRLGRWLGKIKGRAADGKKIAAAELLDGIGRWQLRRV
jgi:hypothetical protein